jgi:iron complex outermembrane receptor protein
MTIKTAPLLLCLAGGIAAIPAAAQDLEEVVVTAQKREQRLQEVPLSVSVVTGAQLTDQGVTDITQLQYSVPGLTYTAGPSPAYSIRGIGTQTFSRSASSDVSVVVDGVIQGQPQPPSNSLFDVQRVETLSGPQGMLFGKNASAGVINVVTNAPDPRENSTSFHADLGENRYQVYQGVENIPLTDHSALRVSAFGNRQDGHLDNVLGNQPLDAYTDYGGRAHYLYDNDAVKISVIADYERDDGMPPIWTVRKASTLAPLLKACGITAGADNTDACLDGPAYRTTKSYGLSAQIDYQIGDYTLTSITADRQYGSTKDTDSDSVALDLLDQNFVHEYDNQVSQELRIASPAHQTLDWVAGLYYYNFDYKYVGEQSGTLGLAPVPLLLDAPLQKIHEYSYAAFGQATWHVWRGLSLLAGLRETRDDISTTGSFPCVPSLGLCYPGVTALGTADDKVSHFNLSYKAGAQYQFDDDQMAYLTYTEGYKGPAINTPYTGNITPTIVQAETPIYVEAGYKDSLFDKALFVNAALFHDLVRNFQAQTLDTQAVPSYFTFANAGKLHSEGFEIDFYGHPISGLRVNGGVTYDNATYGGFLSQCTSVCVGAANVKGNPLANAPRWQTNIGGEYSRPLFDGLNGFAATDVSWRSDVSSSPVPDRNEVIRGYALVNARLGIRSEDGHYGVAFFARNLFDKRFASVIFPDPVSGGANYDQALSPDAFRTLGASIDLNF